MQYINTYACNIYNTYYALLILEPSHSWEGCWMTIETTCFGVWLPQTDKHTLYIPGTQMTSIFEGLPHKTRPFHLGSRYIYTQLYTTMCHPPIYGVLHVIPVCVQLLPFFPKFTQVFTGVALVATVGAPHCHWKICIHCKIQQSNHHIVS